MKFVVAIDFSDNAKKAFDTALRLANPSRDEMVLVTIVEHLEKGVVTSIMVDCDYNLLDKANKHRGKEAAALVVEFEQLCDAAKIPHRSIIQVGDPKVLICAVVESEKADHLFVGSRGLGTLAGLVLGSVSDYCVKHANTVVTVVR